MTNDHDETTKHRKTVVLAQTSDIESILEDTIIRVAEMHERMIGMETHVALLPQIKVLLGNVTAAQQVFANSAQSMAETFAKGEERQERAERRYEKLTEIATGKAQVPLKSHYWTVGVALVPSLLMALVVVLYTLSVTRQDIKASLHEISVEQRETQKIVAEKAREIQNEVASEKPVQ